MEKFIVLAGIIVVTFVGFYIYKKRQPNKPKHVHVEDPEAQAAYDAKNAKKEEEKDLGLSMQERVELSWQFLTRITEKVMTLFSETDKEQVMEAGRQLVKHGAKYQHNVYQESLMLAKAPKAKNIEHSKETERSI